MIVTLDGQRVDRQFNPNCTLQDVITEVRTDVGEACLIVGVQCDGRPLIGDDLQQRLPQPVSSGTQIDLESGEPAQLVSSALRECSRELERVGAEQESIADRLNAGDTESAIEEFGGFIRTWQACQRALVDAGKLLQRDLTEETFEGTPVRDRLAELLERLREVRDAFESRDLVLLADLVNYEHPELCRQWSALFAHLADVCDGPDTAEPKAGRQSHQAPTSDHPPLSR